MRTVESAVVTGPTGAVGIALCRHLLALGTRVWAVVRPDSPRKGAICPGAQAVECDLSDLAALPGLLRGASADAFFHLAWADTTGEGRNDADSQLRNVRCAVDAARAAKRLGCKVFVGAGSQAEYGRREGRLAPDTPAFPESGYGIAKLCAGQMTRLECERLGLAHVWVRILSVYGPGDGAHSLISQAIQALLRGETPALTAGEQIWDYLYSGDAARALALCAQAGRDGAVYVLGSGRSQPLRRYVEAIRDAIDPRLALDFGALAYPPKQVMRLEADISALRRDTGFAPQVPFDQGIQRTIEWMRDAI